MASEAQQTKHNMLEIWGVNKRNSQDFIGTGSYDVILFHPKVSVRHCFTIRVIGTDELDVYNTVMKFARAVIDKAKAGRGMFVLYPSGKMVS